MKLNDDDQIPLNGLLAIRNDQELARWNFPESVGFTLDEFVGVGTGVTLSYSFLDEVPAYYDGSESLLTPPEGFLAFGSEHRLAVETVLDYFSSVVDITFVEETGGIGQITFGFSQQIATTAGHAFYPNFLYSYNQDGIISNIEEQSTGGDVWINASPTSGWSVGDFQIGGDGYNTLLHEIGHALGLKHPFEDTYQLSAELNHTGYTVMAYQDAPRSKVVEVVDNGGGNFGLTAYTMATNSLMVGDIAALQYLYGANTTDSHTDDSYSWAANALFFETIWDSDGVDTIDCANQTFGCEIDLTPGSHSSIALRTTETEIYTGLGLGGYDWVPDNEFISSLSGELYNGSNNLSIAEGTVIENVIGGSGDDQIIGNSADNQIDGGEGIDTVVYSGNYVDYTFSELGSGWSIYGAMEGTDTLVGIESLQFSDQLVSVDQLASTTGGTDSVSGSVNYWGNGAVMGGVALTLTEAGESVGQNMTTTTDGAFVFSGVDLSSGASLQAEKTVLDSTAVNLLDAILVLRQIVGLETFNGYQEIAADLNQSGSADLNDAIGILKHVVDLPTTPPEWLFVEASETPVVGSSMDIASGHSGEIGLIGVLRGDVDGSWEQFTLT